MTKLVARVLYTGETHNKPEEARDWYVIPPVPGIKGRYYTTKSGAARWARGRGWKVEILKRA